MQKVSIVVLNYLNYKDTIECVQSIFNQNYKNYEIIVVDNGSNNDSFKILSDEFKDKEKVRVLNTTKNLGFAEGNNFGIDFSVNKLNIKDVLLVNNDTIFTDQNLISNLMNAKEEGIAVIGPVIISVDGFNQNPVFTEVNKDKILKEKQYYNSFKYKIKSSKFYSKLKSFKNKFKDKKIDKHTNMCGDIVLHGSCMLLTEEYLNKYPRLFPKTFLYYEENILNLLCKKANLKMKYINSCEIYHKEDQSSEMSFKNNGQIKKNYLFTSMGYCEELLDMKYEDILKYFDKTN